MKRQTAFFGFNRGIVSPLALARVDMKRIALSAEQMENWMPRVLGSMMLRPGRKHLGESKSNNRARHLPFIFSTADTAIVELTNSVMRVWVSDALITRVSVASAVTNGAFATDLANWTDSDEAGGASIWSSNYSGSMELLGDGTNAAVRDQQITVAGADQNKEHALRVVVNRGPVTILIGSSQGGNDYLESVIDTGDHSLAFTPTGNFWIRFRNSLNIRKYVGSCDIEAAGVMELPVPWATSDLRNVRYDQSGDILFIACKGFLQRAIERRSTTSWSVARYLVDNGPFGLENTGDIKLTISATTGNPTLTSSRPLFDSGHVDSALFKVTSTSSSTGIARIVSFTASTSVGVEVLQQFPSTVSSSRWSESLWSGVNGFPSSNAFYEGRLWWSGKNGIWGSVSDDFYNMDPSITGNSAPINRTIGSGPVDNVNWILPLQRLILGADGAEWSVRANSFDEILTVSNFNLKRASSQGSDSVVAAQIDSRGVFVSGGTRAFELAFDAEAGDYRSTELTLIAPDVTGSSIVHVAVQRKPDTRIHFVRSDGKVAVMIYNVAENVTCWVLMSSPDALIEDVVVLPGSVEDIVYYSVQRTINGVTKRYLERWAMESQAIGGADNRIADAYVIYSGAATTTITGLDHLEGKMVSIWGNSKDLGTKTVSGGKIEFLSESVTYAVIGLPYAAQWKSTKLSYIVPGEPMSLAQPKRVVHLGLILSNSYYQAIQYGASFSDLDQMPAIEGGKEIAQDTLNTSYDADLFEFPGTWDTDARLCIEANSPRPVTVLAAVLSYDSQEKG